MGPFRDTATMTTVMTLNHVDPGSFSSRCCAFWRKHTSADLIRLRFIQLSLPLTLSLPSRFAPRGRLMVDVSTRALWLAGAHSYDCTFWDDRRGVHTRQPVSPLVDTSTITTITNKWRGPRGCNLTMLYVPAYTHEYRSYSVTSYPTSFTYDGLLAPTIGAQRKTYGLRFTRTQ